MKVPSRLGQRIFTATKRHALAIWSQPSFRKASSDKQVTLTSIEALVDTYCRYAPFTIALGSLETRSPLPKIEDYAGKPNIDLILSKVNKLDIEQVRQLLKEIFCNEHRSVEFMHLENIEEQQWFIDRILNLHFLPIPNDQKIRMSKLLIDCQAYDHFLAKKFPSVKRYGAEGCESMLVFLETLFSDVSALYDQLIMCMPHRGRLNVLEGLLNFPPVAIFSKMHGRKEFPDSTQGAGDVLSHLYTSTTLHYGDSSIYVSLLPNPSHLELVAPVAAGKTRGRIQSLNPPGYAATASKSNILCLMVHGDAAFVGQGIIAETVQMANCPSYSVGGAVHLVVNNQIGFTTEPHSFVGRSSKYCTDVAKMISAPVIHVDAEKPEQVFKAAKLAAQYQHQFRKDVFVDLVCYRRWGHNDIDDPSFTQPQLYDGIEQRNTTPDSYCQNLKDSSLMSNSLPNEWQEQKTKLLNEAFLKSIDHTAEGIHLKAQWSGFVQAPRNAQFIWQTGYDVGALKEIGVSSVRTPESFTVHPHLRKVHCDARIRRVTEGLSLDWATCEALAFGSLMMQGFNVRLSGQDVERGTFSNRHLTLVDRKNGQKITPLNLLRCDQPGHLEPCNSILSELAVLAFEYGMSIENPNRLTLWEAQFGDFFNSAQTVFDTCILSGESKWLLQSGIVILLPHGHDGAGPEHSSCRLERFLQLSDSQEDGVDGESVNCSIANVTTPAQYFHLLRRQMLRPYRKPLVLASPKLLLRHPDCVSSLHHMGTQTHFQSVIDDPLFPSSNPKSPITKIIVCTGKHYFTLHKYRKENKLVDTSLIRIEMLVPFPTVQLQQVLKTYTNAKRIIWSQEEPRNMGAWSFVAPRLSKTSALPLHYAGRLESCFVATSVKQQHENECLQILNETFCE